MNILIVTQKITNSIQSDTKNHFLLHYDMILRSSINYHVPVKKGTWQIFAESKFFYFYFMNKEILKGDPTYCELETYLANAQVRFLNQ